MAKRKKSHPSYRLHRQSGQAVVTLTCAFSGKRRDVLLGEHDTAESWAEYARVIAEWEAAGRVLDGEAKPQQKPVRGVSVAEVMVDWWAGLLKRYGITNPEGRMPSHLYAMRSVVRLVRATCGATPAHEFGPLALGQVRQAMVERGWTRSHVNRSVAVIVRAFRQAVAAEMVKPEAVVALECVQPLKRGELGTAEGKRIKAVPVEHVEAVKPKLSRQVRAIVDMMLLTGARCDEITRMRPIDIDTNAKVWTYRPEGHKTEHHGRERLIHIGPKAQAIIQPFIETRTGVEQFLFSPAEAEAERLQAKHEARTTPLSCGNRPGTNRKAEPTRKPGERYTTEVVRRAIERACEASGVDRWTPHQLRHTAATEIRRAAGVEAAQIILGHSSATLTDSVYAERDYTVARDVIGRVGLESRIENGASELSWCASKKGPP